MFPAALLLAAALAGPQRQVVELHGMALLAQKDKHRVMIAVASDESERGVDHVFRFWSDFELPPLGGFDPAAVIEYDGTEVIFIDAPAKRVVRLQVTGWLQREWVFPEDFTQEIYIGTSLVHETGRITKQVALRVYDNRAVAFRCMRCWEMDWEPGATQCASGGDRARWMSETGSDGTAEVACDPRHWACSRETKTGFTCICKGP